MEQLIFAAILIGIIVGVAVAIRGTEASRLRNALSLATQQANGNRAEADLLRVTLLITEDALKRRDEELVLHDQKIRELERLKSIAQAGELASDTEVSRLAAELLEVQGSLNTATDRLAFQNEFMARAKRAGIRFDGEHCYIDGDAMHVTVSLTGTSVIDAPVIDVPGIVNVTSIAGDDDTAVIVPAGQDGIAGAAQIDVVQPALLADTLEETAANVERASDGMLTVVDANPQPGEIADQSAYDAAIERGTLTEISAEEASGDAFVAAPEGLLPVGEAGWAPHPMGGHCPFPIGSRVDVIVGGVVHRGVEVNSGRDHDVPKGHSDFYARRWHWTAEADCIRIQAHRLLDVTATTGGV